MRRVSQIAFTVLSTFVAANLMAGCPSSGCRYQRGSGPQSSGQPNYEQNYYSGGSFNQNDFDEAPNAYSDSQQPGQMMSPDFNPRQARGYPISRNDQNFNNQGLQESVYYDQYSQGQLPPDHRGFNQFDGQQEENLSRFAAPQTRSNYRLRPQAVDPVLVRDESGYNRNYSQSNRPNFNYSNDSYQPGYSTGDSFRPNYQTDRNYPMDRPDYRSDRALRGNDQRNYSQSTFNSDSNISDLDLNNNESSFNRSSDLSPHDFSGTNPDSRTDLNRTNYNGSTAPSSQLNR
jgi:hypothetical protein